jgi:hypothetical protein
MIFVAVDLAVACGWPRLKFARLLLESSQVLTGVPFLAGSRFLGSQPDSPVSGHALPAYHPLAVGRSGGYDQISI